MVEVEGYVCSFLICDFATRLGLILDRVGWSTHRGEMDEEARERLVTRSNSKITTTSFLLTGTNGYSPEKFYTKSTDGNGHYEQVSQTKISPNLDAFIAEVMEQYSTQYKSRGDLVRDAIMHRIVYLRDQGVSNPEFDASVQRELDMQEMHRYMVEVEQWHSYIDAIGDTVGALVSSRNWSKAAEVLQKVEEQLELGAIPDGQLEEVQRAVSEGYKQITTGIAEKRRKYRD